MSSTAKLGDVVKNVPNALYWLVGACFTAIIAAYVVLSVTGSSAADMSRFINTTLNVAGLVFGSGGFLAAASAAKSIHEARQQISELSDQGQSDTADTQRQITALGKTAGPVE